MKKLGVKLFLAAQLVTSMSFANDCGWSGLSDKEKADIAGGQIIQKADFSQGLEDYTIDAYSFTKSSSLKSSAAAYYDAATTQNGELQIVDTVTLADGQKASNNPVIYQVIPSPKNPLGPLYQPFSYELSVHPEGDAYVFNVNWLTSPVLVKTAQSLVCLVKVNGTVLMRLKTSFAGNPMVGFDKVNPETRVFIWKTVAAGTAMRASKPATKLQKQNLVKALLGNFRD